MAHSHVKSRADGVSVTRGFSIVELMVAVAVAAILAAVALPSFRDMSYSGNVTELTNLLVGDLNTARAEAVRRGTMVGVIANTGGWANGWYIETDGDYKGDGTFAAVPVSSGKDLVLANRGPIPSNGYALNAKAGTGVSTKVVFTAQGTLYQAGSFDFNVCRPDSQPKRSKRITVAGSGMTSSRPDTTGSPATGC